MTLYGLRGITHGGAKVLTVMSPSGARAVCERIDFGDDLIATGGDGRLTYYSEQRSGALNHIIEEYGIIVLSKADWDQKKAELGERIWS
ncbi:MAG: hypothetical protein OEQ39_20070 [Gammaproteobacteria bacterium]|nr:hypothetical protein [Gammaproteobacteria bacterium]MDH3464459.1 hypothetical protein [Gammaproteobacteria bacterium]